MAWTIEYTDTAKTQLRKLGKQTARRIADYMDGRVRVLDNPRSLGRALTGPGCAGCGVTGWAIAV